MIQPKQGQSFLENNYEDYCPQKAMFELVDNLSFKKAKALCSRQTKPLGFSFFLQIMSDFCE